MTNCLKFPRGLKICNLVSKCQYIHEHSKFLSSDGKNVQNWFFLKKLITEVTFWFPQVSSRYHANFLPMLIKINNIQSIKKPLCLSLSDFYSTFWQSISLKEYHCWYQYILGQLITKIIHDPWLSVGQCCRYKVRHDGCTFHFSKQISVLVFSTRPKTFSEVLTKLLDRLSGEGQIELTDELQHRKRSI